MLGIALTRTSPTGRPYIYVQYYPYYGGSRAARPARPSRVGPARPRRFGRAPLSRFTYDNATKTAEPDGEGSSTG